AKCQQNNRKRAPHTVVKLPRLYTWRVKRTARFATLGAQVPAIFLAALLAFCAMGQDASVEQLFAAAMEAQQRGDFSIAVTNYQEIVKLQPRFFGAWANLGVALVK